MPKISEAVACDHPQSGQVYFFIFHQFIYVDHLDHHLLCPMQFHMNGVEVNKTPKFISIMTTGREKVATVRSV